MPAENLADTYRQRSERYAREAERLAARSRLVSNLRGLSFGVGSIAAILAIVGKAVVISSALALIGTLAFVALVAWHARVIRQEDDARRWARVNRDALARVTGGWRNFVEDGRRFADPNHAYADDLDLFGRGSLFQRLSVAHTRFGQETLARYLTSPADVEQIGLRQEAVRALAPALEVRQRLEAQALAASEPGPGKSTGRAAPDPEPLLAWAESEPKLGKRALVVWGARVIPLLTIAGLVAWGWFGQPVTLFTVPLIAGIALNLSTSAESARVFTAVSSTEGAFLRYGAMLEVVETLEVGSALLEDMKKRLVSTGRRPSQAMSEFRSAVGWFDLRHNGLVHPFVNALLLWDTHCVLRLEKWQIRSGRSTREWFRALGEVEALSSLAGFCNDEPGVSFAELVSDPPAFEAETLVHPLLDPAQRVANDVRLPEPGRALLVTGSNMSGKSTLLRAMGLAAVLALAGAPVPARRLRIGRFAVLTSMRISDSLERGVSHFYAEVKKLKLTVDAAHGELPVLFLLDEILHGTNSRERQIGARWVLREMLERGALGAISTHDMELCRLPDELMTRVTLVHFQESVVNDQMTFDYKLRPGPVTAGNALRLMKLVGLDVPLE